jgi:signal peptidase I
MIKDEPNSATFEALSRDLLNKGMMVRFVARGESMFPLILNGDTVHIISASADELRKGHIVLAKSDSGFRVHRLVFVDHDANMFITRGDSCPQNDPPVPRDQILGRAVAKDVQLGVMTVRASFHGIVGRLLRLAARAQNFLTRRLRVKLLRAKHWTRRLADQP